MVMMLNPPRGHWQSPEAPSSKGRAQWRRDWWSWGSSRLRRRRRWRTVDSFVGRCTGWATCSGGQRCGHTCNHGRRDIGDIGFSSGNTGRQAVKGTLRMVIVSWWSGCRFLWGDFGGGCNDNSIKSNEWGLWRFWCNISCLSDGFGNFVLMTIKKRSCII